MRRAQLPEHTCGWSPQYRRTVSNDECERCRAEDELVLDTQRFDQRMRSWVHRPTRASQMVSAADIPAAGEPVLDTEEPELRRETFVPLSDTEQK
ncbi:hypothetical protein ASF40_06330 [Microbacterium sp. Leaf288]|uniref:hypothetical protein n=1 Tax=Microbacterium sp. Leaf288 TaxID=1736323 RepID=UPI0006F387F9|nr:hypothetical protein [Microbacterium sp. Leaf288]KQP71388.1 hypothetical protein ASF40_06330 [Microbacterium sp. Leaf288]